MIKPETRVILVEAPLELTQGLPEEDCVAIQSVVGEEVLLVGYDDRGYAELEFEYGGDIHTIWVDPKYVSEEENNERLEGA